MKKLFILILAVALPISFVACGGNNNSGGNSTGGNAGNNTASSAPANNSGSKTGSVTIAGMKQAAKDAGQGVKDDYPNPWGTWEIANGFTIIYNDTDETFVLEFVNQADADACVQREKEAGYNLAVQNGKFVVTITGDGKGGAESPEELTFMQNLLNGKPLK